MNAIELLIEQHDKVKSAIDDMLKADSVDDDALLEVADQLVAHMVIEEHVFYPRVRQLKPELVSESFEEHTVARFELGRAILAAGDEKHARVMVLRDLLEHHISEEEKSMFPKVERALDAAELEELGARMKRMFDKAAAKGFSKLVVEGYSLRGGNHGVGVRTNGYARAASKKQPAASRRGGAGKKTSARSAHARH